MHGPAPMEREQQERFHPHCGDKATKGPANEPTRRTLRKKQLIKWLSRTRWGGQAFGVIGTQAVPKGAKLEAPRLGPSLGWKPRTCLTVA